MELDLYPHFGHFGRSMPLEVLADGPCIGVVAAGRHFGITLHESVVALRVSMQGAVGSRPYRLPRGARVVKLECGNPSWVAFDLLSLCYLPPLRDRVFFLRAASPA